MLVPIVSQLVRQYFPDIFGIQAPRKSSTRQKGRKWFTPLYSLQELRSVLVVYRSMQAAISFDISLHLTSRFPELAV